MSDHDQDNSGLEEETFLIAKNIDRNLRGSLIATNSSLIYVINIFSALLGLIVFGLGLHVALQGFGASRAVFIISLCGLVSAILSLMCFYGIRILILDVDSPIGISLIRLYLSGGTMFCFLSSTLGITLIALRPLLIRYMTLHWTSSMEVVMANMSLSQGINYMNQSIAIFVVLNLLIAILICYNAYSIWQIIPSSETLSQLALWIHFIIGILCTFLFGFSLYTLYRPVDSAALDYSTCYQLVMFASILFLIQIFSVLRISSLSKNAWYTSLCLCYGCSSSAPGRDYSAITGSNVFDHNDVLEPKSNLNPVAMFLHVFASLAILVGSFYCTIIAVLNISGLNFNGYALLSSYLNSIPTSHITGSQTIVNAGYSTLSSHITVLNQKITGYSIFSLLILIDILLIFALIFAVTLKPFTVAKQKNN